MFVFEVFVKIRGLVLPRSTLLRPMSKYKKQIKDA